MYIYTHNLYTYTYTYIHTHNLYIYNIFIVLILLFFLYLSFVLDISGSHSAPWPKSPLEDIDKKNKPVRKSTWSFHSISECHMPARFKVGGSDFIHQKRWFSPMENGMNKWKNGSLWDLQGQRWNGTHVYHGCFYWGHGFKCCESWWRMIRIASILCIGLLILYSTYKSHVNRHKSWFS